MDRNAARLLIKKHLDDGLPAVDIVRLVQPHGILKHFVYPTYKQLNQTGSIADHCRSGRPRSISLPAPIQRIQENIRRNAGCSVQGMAKEERVPRESLCRLVKLDTGFRPYHKRKVARLSNKQVEKRFKGCKTVAIVEHCYVVCLVVIAKLLNVCLSTYCVHDTLYLLHYWSSDSQYKLNMNLNFYHLEDWLLYGYKSNGVRSGMFIIIDIKDVSIARHGFKWAKANNPSTNFSDLLSSI
uniref:Transposase n=1 Tax=Romanomermis culicivorax TaxID=13658 RepID=A0A915KKS7_ROMCU